MQIENTQLPVTHPTGSYNITVGYELLPCLSEYAPLESKSSVAIVTDNNVGPAHINQITQNLNPAAIVQIPAGESHKTLATVNDIYSQLLAAGLDRRSAVVSLGGGVVNDITGFVAATYMRGISFVTCPTSLLSMVDASVGGKTGVDMPEGKNLVGAFKQPDAVVADAAVLATLPAVEFSAGMAEIIKHGLINAPELLTEIMVGDWLDLHQALDATAGSLSNDENALQALQSLIVNAIRVKRDVVQEDPFEGGRRALLNLGHTFGHAIEQVSGYRIGHGQGVAMGLVCAAKLSALIGHCDADLQLLVEATLRHVGLPTRIPADLDLELIVEAMGQDKKKEAGKLRFILLKRLGQAFISDEVDYKDVIYTLQLLQDRS